MSFRKILLAFILSSLLAGVFVLRVKADFDQQKIEFTKILEEYNNSYSDFQIAKNSYETYRTLSSLTSALDKSKIYLQKRDELIIKHLELLITKIDELNFSDESFKNSLVQKAGDEINFFQVQNNLIPAIATINDVNRAAQKAEDEIPLTNIRSKQILGTILITKIRGLMTDYDATTKNITDKINEIKTKSTRSKSTTDKWERWLVEVNNKRTLADNGLLQGTTDLNAIKINDNVEKKFDQIRINIVQSSLYLKEGANFIKEILGEMKYD